MNLTHDDVMSFALRFSKLYKSKQRLMLEEVEAIKDQLDKESHQAVQLGCDDWIAFEAEHRPKRSGWHWVWCIVANATLTHPDQIPDDIWIEAMAMLERYERGRVENKVLVIDDPDHGTTKEL